MACSTGGRHWFTYYGMVGTSAPVCQRCGAPNPHYDSLLDPWADMEPPGYSAGIAELGYEGDG